MIDPNTAFAFSLFENRGVYALLLGSGVSRSAQIPTGWEITLDLNQRLGLLEGETDQAPMEGQSLVSTLLVEMQSGAYA